MDLVNKNAGLILEEKINKYEQVINNSTELIEKTINNAEIVVLKKEDVDLEEWKKNKAP